MAKTKRGLHAHRWQRLCRGEAYFSKREEGHQDPSALKSFGRIDMCRCGAFLFYSDNNALPPVLCEIDFHASRGVSEPWPYVTKVPFSPL